MQANSRTFILFLLFFISFNKEVDAQCVTPINIFPYTEGFESSDGGWTTGGVSSDWVRGAPTKNVITGAGEGSICWIIGGTSGNKYNDAENSWLQSPCFDFTSLVNPQISFKVFWETERQYDGATFQYSLDGGFNFTTLGSVNSNSNCLSSNWFNYAPINFLGGEPGWSGNIQPTSGSCQGGNGSNGWKIASHTLSTLAGEPSVIFRFRFASGNICNEFNGFAVDYVQINEVPPSNTVDFATSCQTYNTIEFTNNAQPCQANILWNFDDIGSGAANTSSQDNVIHVFSTPGLHQVKLTVTFQNGISNFSMKDIYVLAVSTTVADSISCHGDNSGSVESFVTGGTGTYNYSWNTSPAQFTPGITNLSPGNYTVSITSPNACLASASVVLTEPDDITISINSINEKCGNQKGSLTATVQGGTLPYNYLWSQGAITSSISNLSAGIYSLSVTDDKGCTKSTPGYEIKNIISPASVYLGADTFICPGKTLLLSPGSYADYLWQDGSTAAVFPVTVTGTYGVRVTDYDGCVGEDSITVTVDCSDVFFPSAFTPNGDGKNEDFGPLGNIAAVRNYSINIYNRYGQLVFYSNHPARRWDGTFKGKPGNTETFVWSATYELNGKSVGVRKGTITLFH